MNHNYNKLKKAVESTGNTFIDPKDIDYTKVKPVKMNQEERLVAELEDIEYHKKLLKYYIENP